MKRNYKEAFIYARLSNDRHEQSNVSVSIKTQIDICSEFAKNNGLFVSKIYFDDGVSGTTFDRPQFKKMIEDFKTHSASTLIIKDLSRLGRNFLQTSFYIEDYFPNNNIRLIAVNDSFDSFGEDKEMDVAIRNFANGYYAKECSKKLKQYYDNNARRKSFAKEGSYGYVVVKRKLQVDELVRDVIETIFNLYASGKSLKNIVRYLIENKIDCPAYHKRYVLKQAGNKYKPVNQYAWNTTIINKILRNPIYIGDVVNQATYKNPKTKRRVKNPNPVIIQNNHEGIISRELFDIVQKKFRIQDNEGDNLDSLRLKNFFFTEDGKTFIFSRNKKSKCKYYRLRDGSVSIKTDVLHELVYNDVKLVYTALNYHPDEFIKNYYETYVSAIKNKNESTFLKRKNKIESKIKDLFEKYIDGMVTDNEYHKLLKEYNIELNEINNSLIEYQSRKAILDARIENLKQFIKNIPQLNDETDKLELIKLLVKKAIIRVDGNGIYAHIMYKFEI